MDKIFKIDGKLYIKVHEATTWVVKIYDYEEEYLKEYSDDERKYHRIQFGTHGEAIHCMDNYTESKDKRVALEKIVVHFRHILLNEQKEIIFKSIEEQRQFFNDGGLVNFNKDDLNLIMRVEEFKLKEQHHDANMEKMKELIKAVRSIY